MTPHLPILIAIAAASAVPSASAQDPADAKIATPDSPPSASADSLPPPSAADEGWRLSLAVPAWIPSVSGEVHVNGRKLSPRQDTGN